MMAATPNDVAALMYGANIASLRNEVEQHHICEANASYRVSDISLKHKTIYDMIYQKEVEIWIILLFRILPLLL